MPFRSATVVSGNPFDFVSACTLLRAGLWCKECALSELHVIRLLLTTVAGQNAIHSPNQNCWSWYHFSQETLPHTCTLITVLASSSCGKYAVPLLLFFFFFWGGGATPYSMISWWYKVNLLISKNRYFLHTYMYIILCLHGFIQNYIPVKYSLLSKTTSQIFTKQKQ